MTSARTAAAAVEALVVAPNMSWRIADIAVEVLIQTDGTEPTTTTTAGVTMFRR